MTQHTANCLTLRQQGAKGPVTTHDTTACAQTLVPVVQACRRIAQGVCGGNCVLGIAMSCTVHAHTPWLRLCNNVAHGNKQSFDM